MNYTGKRLVMGFCLPKDEKEDPSASMFSIPLPSKFADHTKFETVIIPKFTHRSRSNLKSVMAEKMGLNPLFTFPKGMYVK